MPGVVSPDDGIVETPDMARSLVRQQRSGVPGVVSPVDPRALGGRFGGCASHQIGGRSGLGSVLEQLRGDGIAVQSDQERTEIALANANPDATPACDL
jgi:hypothetical protein